MLDSFLYKINLVGASPQLLIFKNQRYKSIISSLFSIIIILTTIIFSILTLYDYFKYQSPTVIYSKANDEETNRKINMKDSFLIFQLVDASNKMKINSSIAYYEGEYKVMYDNGTYEAITLEISNCEIGKNLDIKYKEHIDHKNNFNRSISDYYCINFNEKNLSLFYLPNVGYSYFNLYILKNNQIDFPPERIQSLISSENDLIDHYNKKKPISENNIYYFTSSFSSNEFTNIMYYFQYIKYESDEGFFYENSRKLDGISFSDMTFYKSLKQNFDLKNDTDKDNIIGSITIEINQSNFDSYKRSYKKFQALLAEVMSVISLLFQIGEQVSIVLCDKKMSKDIIFNLINNNIKNNKKKLSIPNTKINILNTEHKNADIINKKKINQNSSKNSDNLNSEKSYESKLNKEKQNKTIEFDSDKNNNQNYINEVKKKINYLHIIKSFFCFNDKKTKLIDLCHDIVTEDISIERIFERFYNLEKAYNFISGKKNKKLFNEQEKLQGIRKCINKIYYEEQNQNENKINSEIEDNKIK